ncbi:MAG: DUF2017 family protein [Actinomycetota bacterium]|nr:DUF2017 family protein [Actinomycetota bacterium]
MTEIRGPLKQIEGDRFENLLTDEEKELLGMLPGVVVEAIAAHSPYVTRLFPPTYPFDHTAQKEIEDVGSDSLAEEHRRILEGLADTVNKPVLTHQDLVVWVGAINDIRLLIGTALDVYEEMDRPGEDDPRFQDFVIFDYLTWLQGSLLAFLSGQLGKGEQS